MGITAEGPLVTNGFIDNLFMISFSGTAEQKCEHNDANYGFDCTNGSSSHVEIAMELISG